MTEHKASFPILDRIVNGRKVVYLDNAATMQIPQMVLDAVQERAITKNANVHRGIHRLSEESTEDYEGARKFVAEYLNVLNREIVFTSGTTHSINLVAASLAGELKPGDHILTTRMEHHSNFIPWQQIAREKGAEFSVVELNSSGDLRLEELEGKLTKRTKLVAVTQCSNVLGTVNDVAEICRLAHERNVPVLVDGAQGIAHSHVDLRKMDCDYYCFSAHKVMGLTGTGVLYAKGEAMKKLRPFQYGGGMVKYVDDMEIRLEEQPYCLEAGTPNFVGATGLEAALRCRLDLGEQEYFGKAAWLLELAEKGLERIERVHILGKPRLRRGCISFVAEGAHPYDIAMLLDQKGIAVRSGHHCAMPLLTSLGLEYALRISPAFYNTEEEIQYFLDSLKQILSIL